MSKQQPDSREKLADRLEEESRGLKWCLKHELVVWYDGPAECPACQIINEQREEAAKEFLNLTRGLFSSQTKPVEP